MSFEELLESLGIEQAEIEKITGGMKENKIYLSANEHIDDRYTKLKAQNDSNAEALSQANALIEQLKGDSASTEQMKAQIAEYQKQAEEAKAELAAAQLDNAVKVALMGAKATDIDYMAFKLRESGELELDEKGNIKGIDDKLATLKTRFPNQFEAAGKKREIDPSNLPGGDGGDAGGEPKSLAEALQQKYEQKDE